MKILTIINKTASLLELLVCFLEISLKVHLFFLIIVVILRYGNLSYSQEYLPSVITEGILEG